MFAHVLFCLSATRPNAKRKSLAARKSIVPNDAERPAGLTQAAVNNCRLQHHLFRHSFMSPKHHVLWLTWISVNKKAVKY